MTKAIKPIIGKRENIPIENKPIEKSILKQDEFKSINIMGNIDRVMIAWDQYSNITHRKRNAVPYVQTKIPDKSWSPGYIRSLRSYGTRLKDAGVYEQALQEDWDFVKISNYFRRNKQIKQKETIKAEESKPVVEAEPDVYKDYIKKIRPWER